MTIFYGKFLEADEILLRGKFYYEYFNSEEAIYKYKDFLKSMGIHDVLERIGKAEFNKNGRLVFIEKSEKILYDPEWKYKNGNNSEQYEDEDEEEEEE